MLRRDGYARDDRVLPSSANLAGETFAYAMSTAVGTSPEASIFIAGRFGIVVDVMMSLRKH